MTERSVTVRISATDNFSTIVDRYNQKMGQSEAATRQMGEQSQTAKSRTEQLTGAVKGFIAGIAIQQVVSFAENLNAAGVEARDASIKFEALASQIGNSRDLMDKLRTATLNVVDDTTLQQGATQLMQMGLAETNEEVTKLIELAIKLKRPTESAAEAVNSFGLMLANQSVMRLDNFGISSGKVRERIAELQAQFQGMQRDEAFKLAVMEIGQQSLDRLGSAADVAGTSLNRLQTRIANLQSEIAVNFATGVEGILGIGEIALGLHPEQQRQAQEAANLFAADFQMALNAAMSETSLQGADQNFVSDFMSRAIRAAQDDPHLGQDALALRNKVLGEFGVFSPEDALGPNGGLADMAGQINALAQIASYTVSNNRLARETLTLQGQQADEAARQAEIQAAGQRHLENVNRFLRDGVNLWTEMTGRAREAVGLHDQIMGGVGFIGEQADAVRFGQFATPEQAATLARLNEEAAATVKLMEQLDKVNPELFSDSEMEFARMTAEHVGTLADEAERAADAFAKIRLSDIFGQGGGGVTGEIGDLLLRQMEAGGATPEQIAATRRALDLQSGRETAGSLALQEEIVPELAKLADDPELVARMTAKLSEVLVKAALEGIDTNSPEFLSMLQGEVGAAAEGGEAGVAGFDPEGFVTSFQTLDEKASTFQQSISAFLTDITSSQEPVTAIETAMGQISTYATTVRDRLTELTSRVQQITVKVKVEYEDARGWLEQQVRSNGGVVPGAVGPQ